MGWDNISFCRGTETKPGEKDLTEWKPFVLEGHDLHRTATKYSCTRDAAIGRDIGWGILQARLGHA